MLRVIHVSFFVMICIVFLQGGGLRNRKSSVMFSDVGDHGGPNWR